MKKNIHENQLSGVRGEGRSDSIGHHISLGDPNKLFSYIDIKSTFVFWLVGQNTSAKWSKLLAEGGTAQKKKKKKKPTYLP